MRTRLQAFRRATEYTDDRIKEEFFTLGEEVSLCRPPHRCHKSVIPQGQVIPQMEELKHKNVALQDEIDVLRSELDQADIEVIHSPAECCHRTVKLTEWFTVPPG